MTKLTLSRLENLLLTACDDLRGSMDASEYKEDIEIELEDKDNYSGKYFYVPPRARWNTGWVQKTKDKDGKDAERTIPALKHLKKKRRIA